MHHETSNDSAGEVAAQRKRVNPFPLITALVLLFCLALFVWHLLADRFTPYTDQARVEAFTVPVAPQVSGYLVDIPVDLHDRVEGGQVLAQIDRETTKSIDFIFDYSFFIVNEESGSYIHHMLTGLEFELTSLLDFDVTFVWDRIQDPRENSDGTFPEQDDFQLTLGLGFDL